MPPASVLLPQRYDWPVVLLSVLIAGFSAYVALDLMRHARGSDRVAARYWTLGGAIVLGSGLWAMHFEGMLALQLPLAVGYEPGPMLLSWLVAMALSGLALHAATRQQPSPAQLAAMALVMGGGISATHYTGMAALRLEPGLAWNGLLVGASVLLACAASAAALLLAFAAQRLPPPRARLGQAAASLLLALAISGMHYTGMAAAGFPAGAVCLSRGGLDGTSLGALVVIAVTVLMLMALLACGLAGRMLDRTHGLTRSLHAANAQLEEAAAQRRRLALQDPLTGVANLALFEDRLAQAVARAQRLQAAQPQLACGLAVLCVDVDGFKPINDGWGHAAGDALLRQLAARLSVLAREVDTVARVGGDEFVLLLENLHSLDEAVAVAQRLLEHLEQPFALPQRPLRISCSVGIAMVTNPAEAAHLFAGAEAAMYNARLAGGGGWWVFEPAQHRGMFEVVDTQHALRETLDAPDAQLQLHYQPKVDARDGRVVGVEALLRWTHPVRGPVSPVEFIPVAERFGLIARLGDWVIDTACRQIAAWAAQGRAVPVAVNFSGHQLRQADMAQRVRQALQRHGVPARLLVCEVTESVAMENTHATQRVLAELRALGVMLSIDDFGTGYSSLASLRQLKAQELKIDRSFVRDLATDADARAVVDAVVHLAHALGLRVVAEGVETAEQQRLLGALGCDQLQGFHFARPQPAHALEASGMLPAATVSAAA
jgi:diguanylate cyclase (GGDEF)-like protein